MARINGKVNLIPRCGYVSSVFLMVKNFKDPNKHYSEHKIIHNFGSVRDYEKTQANVEKFWNRVDTVLAAYVAANKITLADAEKVKRKFDAHFPRAQKPIAKPKLQPIAKSYDRDSVLREFNLME